MGLYNWGLEYRWGPVKTDLTAESERIRRQIREAKKRRKEGRKETGPPKDPGTPAQASPDTTLEIASNSCTGSTGFMSVSSAPTD